MNRYFPYFRGKQYELIAIRETASLMKSSGFVPIIEPVRSSMGTFNKTIKILKEEGAECIVVVNPSVGDFENDTFGLIQTLSSYFSEENGIRPAVLLHEETSIGEVRSILTELGELDSVLIHNGFSEPIELNTLLSDFDLEFWHVFVDGKSGKLYRRHFRECFRILLKDGFNKQKRNRDYHMQEHFSDLHIIYEEEGVNAFGDFLTVGDEYSESGGPAYTVAIHLTYINDKRDDEMWVYHFLSDSKDDAIDPAGKFAEALEKLSSVVSADDSVIYRGTAVTEFIKLHSVGHFPGLGYVKKLSMIHHVETLANYFSQQ